MNLNKYLDIAPEVQQALADGRPVVALESTIISHGMPYPKNVETALLVEQTLRDNGAVPATIAILGGRLKAGLSKEEITYLGKSGRKVAKVSRRDLPVICARGMDGATTVTTTMMIAHMAGIQVFATGGIGGVHRGAETTMDISADLEELAHTPVMVVCAGAKSILDLGLTLEYLETHGVPVLGYQTKELPAFYTRKSGFAVDYEIDTPAELAKAFYVKQDMGLGGGMLVTNPIPEEYSMDADVINKAIDEAVEEAKAQGIHGKETTPFLLARVKDLTGGGFITARGINDKYMTSWKQSALMILLTNYVPKMDTDDDGFNARTLFIEWPVKFVPNPTREWERQIDRHMGKKLEAERSGILALMVRGCMDVLANGLRIPEKVLRFTEAQMAAQDDIGRFLKECCLIEEPPTGSRDYETRTPAADLLKVCNWWCKKILGNSYPYTPKKFTPALEKKGIFTKKSSVMYYLGVVVKPEILEEYNDDLLEEQEKNSRRKS